MTNGSLKPLVKRVSWCIFRNVRGIWWIWKVERLYGAKKNLSGVYGEKIVVSIIKYLNSNVSIGNYIVWNKLLDISRLKYASNLIYLWRSRKLWRLANTNLELRTIRFTSDESVKKTPESTRKSINSVILLKVKNCLQTLT